MISLHSSTNGSWNCSSTASLKLLEGLAVKVSLKCFLVNVLPSAKVFVHLGKKLIYWPDGDRDIKLMILVLSMASSGSKHSFHTPWLCLIELFQVFQRDLSPHFFRIFFPIFENGLTTSNECHFQTVKARATRFRSYERSFNVVLGSHKVFLIILSETCFITV